MRKPDNKVNYEKFWSWPKLVRSDFDGQVVWELIIFGYGHQWWR